MRSVESCKTELNSDPMTNTGSVPFVWEHSPGRPKDETDKRRIQTKESPPSLPKLPPGWILKPKKKDSDNVTEDLSTEFESAKLAKKESSDSGNDDDDDDDDTDEAFMDALDTLSRGESSFYNCSASGVSGLESNVKPSGILSADPKVRDFMMGRFLPAAKAMVSEVPQNASRKHVVKEKPREVKRITNVDSKKVQLRYGPNFLQDMIRDNDEEEEDSDYEYDEHGNISSKLCGFLPRFCLKGSVGHVNPVSGTRTANRTHASSSTISSFSETENEPARIAIYEHRSFDRSSVPETSNQNIYNRLPGRGISYEGSQSFVPERNNPSSQKKRATSFKELLADDKNKNEQDDQDFLIEKTLYVDTVHMIKSPKGQSKFRAEDTDMMVADDESQDQMKMETHMDEDPEEWIDVKNGDQDLKGSQDGVFELPAPPPLPKSPSDSWLWRTLPSVSSKNTNTAIRWNPKYPPSNAQIGHSEGPLLPIPES
ncbi:hypothetical protein L6452_20629 [Arctium lappa]|uniref:Uncharacterized protein n=1 Tax=Arctium lappa TaxID=4217 RepID=A0ACB9BCF2_ARCLA|nr:hypothetical protein L6452_20629 [Arctium lappa]